MPDVNPGTSGLVSWWAMDTGALTTDSHGSNTLTDNNTVGSGTGKQAECGDFEASNSEWLSIADNADVSLGDVDFTLCAWVKAESLTGNVNIILGKDTVSNREFAFGWLANRFFLSLSVSVNAIANSLGAPSTGTWYFVVAWHDQSANTLYIQVDNGTVDSATYSGTPIDAAAAFGIGGREYPGFMDPWDGLIDEVCIYKRVLSADERSFLYSAGSGVSYATVSGSGATIPATMHRMIPAGPIRIINASG